MPYTVYKSLATQNHEEVKEDEIKEYAKYVGDAASNLLLYRE